MSNRPNILFILTDQQRKDTLSIYDEQGLCQTPVLDALANQSTVFDEAYTTCPICTPARASLQTGLFPMHHGMLTNSYNYGNMVQELPDSPELLSRRLQKEGYQIGYTGKWHLGTGAQNVRQDAYIQKYMGDVGFAELAMNAASVPTKVGYTGDDFPGHGFGGYIYPQFKEYLASKGKKVKIEHIISGNYTSHQAGEITSGLDTTIEHYLVERSKEIIDGFSKQENPWYVQLNFWGPHEPYYAPTEFLNNYREQSIPPWKNYQGDSPNKPKIHDVKRANDTSWEKFVPYIRHYFANMSHIDYQIGRLIEYLKEKELYDNTLIIFSSDHGESLGIHNGLCDKAIFMYEEICSIPLLVKLPNQVSMTRKSAFVNSCDIYSTILDVAGMTDYQRDGTSFLPILTGEKESLREVNVTECSGIGSILFSQRMLRYKQWKYVFNAGDIDELYHLATDSGELINLIDHPDFQERKQELQQLLEEWMKENNDNLLFEYQYLRRR